MIDPRPWWLKAPPVEPGYWLVRYRLGPGKYGPLIPAAVVRHHTRNEPDTPGNLMERSAFWVAYIAGEVVSIWDLQASTHTEGTMLRRERAITEAEYRFRLAERAWAREHAPDDLAGADARKPIDLLSISPPL